MINPRQHHRRVPRQVGQFTATIINEVNKIHASGQGMHGYTSVTGTYQVDDPNAQPTPPGSPSLPPTAAFRSRSSIRPRGSPRPTPSRSICRGQSQDHAERHRRQLNAVANITASATSDGGLQIDAANGFEIEFAADNSGLLASLGVNTFFTGSSSLDIGVNSQLVADPAVAAAQGAGRDARTPRSPISRTSPPPARGHLVGGFSSRPWPLGQSSASQSAMAQGAQGFIDSLANQKAQFSGSQSG
jgi:flagellar hook-associated protein 1 FlgK